MMIKMIPQGHLSTILL